MRYELEGVSRQFTRWQVSTLDGMSPLGYKPWVIYMYPYLSIIISKNVGNVEKCIGGLLVIF